MSGRLVLLAGGGTGGHVFPAIAVADAMRSATDVEVVFCGTARGVEVRVVPARGWRLELLDVEPLKGGGAARAARGTIFAALATWHAVDLVRRLRPQVVLSVGGYAAGPVTLAAALLGVRVAVLEPNRVVGLANRLLAPFARRAYVAWDEAGACFRPAARRCFGVPLRPSFVPKPYTPRPGARLLVMGGSQGAEALDQRMPGALARLADVPGLEVLHQAGRDRVEAVRGAYERQRVSRATVVPFIDDVATALAHADIVVARAGAGTLAEITCIGRAAVLVPFPHAADDHQAKNAEALAQAGAAVCIRQQVADEARLAVELRRLFTDERARRAMADASRARGKPNAARDIAEDLLALGAA